MNKGKLIVLEGIDGSGKSSQFRMLCERFDELGIKYHHVTFPRYSKDSSSMLRHYLHGDFGTRPEDVNAYTASTFYAVDRFASFKEDWQDIYTQGGFILCDRYVSSNAVHQGCKLSDDELPYFFDWLTDLEYNKMGLPKPDKVIYLDVDLELSLSRMRKREAETNTNADIHEKDNEYLKKCLHTAEKAAEHFGWTRIPCRDNGIERGIKDKNDEIFNIVMNALKSGE